MLLTFGIGLVVGLVLGFLFTRESSPEAEPENVPLQDGGEKKPFVAQIVERDEKGQFYMVDGKKVYYPSTPVKRRRNPDRFVATI